MPRNTSGLRRGGPGRPKGSKDAVPRSFRASIRRIFEQIGEDEPELYENAIREGLRSRRGSAAFNLVQLAAFYLDGKPADTVQFKGQHAAPCVVVLPAPAPAPSEN